MRKAVAILVGVLLFLQPVLAGAQRLSPQGGTITSVTPSAPLAGGGSAGALTISLTACVTSGHSYVWNGAAFACTDVTTAAEFASAIVGTSNTMAKFTGANAVGNSLLTDSGTSLAYATNKFTVAAASGNAAFAGTLSAAATSVTTLTASGAITDTGNRVFSIAGDGLDSSGATVSVKVGSGLQIVADEVTYINTVIQSRVSGTCTAPQAVVSIASNGTVVCTSTNVDGTGSANTLSKWSDADTLANSLLTDNATTLAYNTNKFTVAAASGNTTVAGTLDVTGLLTATAGVTTPANLTTTGTGDLVSADDLLVTDDATISGGVVTLNNGTSNIIDFGQNGVGAPTFTTRSAGTKVVVYNAVAGATVDAAIGVEASTLWYSTFDSSSQHKWYAGTTSLMTLSGVGVLNVTGSITENGSPVLSGSITDGVIPMGSSGNLVDSALSYNSIDTVTTTAGISIARSAGAAPFLVLGQSGQTTWQFYEPVSANTFHLWNSTHGDVATWSGNALSLVGTLSLSGGNYIYINGSGDSSWYIGKDGATHDIYVNGSGSGTRSFKIRDSGAANAVRFAVDLDDGNTTVSGNLSTDANLTAGNAVGDGPHAFTGHVTMTDDTDGLAVTSAANIASTATIKAIASASSPYGAGIWIDSTATGGDNWMLFSTGSGAGEGAGQLIFKNTSDNAARFILGSAGQLFAGDTTNTFVDNNVDVLTIGNTGTGQTSANSDIKLTDTGSWAGHATTATYNYGIQIDRATSCSDCTVGNGYAAAAAGLSIDMHGDVSGDNATYDIALLTKRGYNHFNTDTSYENYFGGATYINPGKTLVVQYIGGYFAAPGLTDGAGDDYGLGTWTAPDTHLHINSGNSTGTLYLNDTSNDPIDIGAAGTSADVTIHQDATLEGGLAVGVERRSTDGAASLSKVVTYVSGTGTDVTLADGSIDGQLKTLVVTGGTGTLTPTTLADGNVLTWSGSPASATLVWDNSGGTWHVVGTPLNMVITP